LSVAEGTHSYAQRGHGGKLLFDHRQASEHWNLSKRPERIKALREAYGPAAAWMDLPAIADYWDDPQASHAEFRRFWLNQPVPLAGEMPSVIDLARWSASADSVEPSRAALAVAVAQDRSWSCIGAAGAVGEGRTAVMCHSLRGTASVATKIVELLKVRDIVEVRLAGAQAKSLVPSLTAAGVEFDVMTATELGASCAAFQEAVKHGAVCHRNQYELNLAVENAQTRMSGESEVWDRRDPKVDDSPLVACSAAFYAWSLLVEPNYDVLESIR
jgi:hypothetical protein